MAHSLKLTALAAIVCICGPPCIIGKTALSMAVACSALQTMAPERGPRSTLWVVKVTTSAKGTGLGIALPATRPMKCAASTQKIAPTSSAMARKSSKSMSRGMAAAGEDHLGPVLAGELLDLVVVDVLGVLVDPVVDGVEPLAGEGHLRAVGQVPAVRQAHREDRLAGLHEGAVDGLVRTGAGVRLHVGVVGLEERLAPLDGDLLGLVDLGQPP